MNAARARKQQVIPLGSTSEATESMRVTERSTLSMQVSGTHTTGKIRLQWRLEGGDWLDAEDSEGADIEITGEGIVRNVNVSGVDEVRPVVQTTESGKEALVIMCAWGDER
tara:strand:+ start:265 stop:597 length:333 start_codon:yes stop_codon:yes gene_type:complete